MVGPLADRVILVTGGETDLGRSVAEEAATLGAAVVVNADRDIEAATHVVQEIHERGGSGLAVLTDLTDERAVGAMVNQARAELGPITAVVHGASFVAAHQRIDRLPPEVWRRVLEVTLDGAFLCARATLPSMVELGFGRFVFIGGTAGSVGLPRGSAPWAAAEAGLDGLARSIAQEFGRVGITANVVVPGPLSNERTQPEHLGDGSTPVGTNAIGRLVAVDEAAAVCLLLCSRVGAVNGARVLVDGGLTPR